MKKVFTTVTTHHLNEDVKTISTVKRFKIFGFTYWSRVIKLREVAEITTVENSEKEETTITLKRLK